MECLNVYKRVQVVSRNTIGASDLSIRLVFDEAVHCVSGMLQVTHVHFAWACVAQMVCWFSFSWLGQITESLMIEFLFSYYVSYDYTYHLVLDS